MDRKLDDNLCRIAPNLFADRHASMQGTCMCWGFEVGDGWYDLIGRAALELEPLIVRWIADNPYPNDFPSWIFSRYNMHISLQWRCYSFLAIWQWVLIGLGLRKPDPWWPRASQIKEKYGTLRFYMTSGTNEMYTITDKAERQSSMTCETCGEPGRLRGRGWYYTACNRHTKKEDRKVTK